MSCMFNRCLSLESLDITSFDTSKVKYMRLMFGECTSLTYLDLSHFDTSSLLDMAWMFYECKKLISINLSGFNTTLVTEFDYTFFGCESLQSLDLTDFETTNAHNMRNMFYRCSSLTCLDLSKFDTTQVTIMCEMFAECSSLISLDLSEFTTNNVKDMYGMFGGCKALISLDISTFDTSQVTDISFMFRGCEKLISINILSFNVEKVLNMTALFEKCSNLKYIDLSKFKTTSTIKMEHMFMECTSLESLDLSELDTSKVIDMNNMFRDCNNLKSLDLKNFDTRNVENMEWMFYECFKLESLDISSFSTSKVKSMAAMFVRCESLKTLDITNFDTSSVINALHMFEGCSLLTSLDISKFVTSSMNNMHAMFISDINLISLDLSNFDFSQVKDIEYMFAGCQSLKYLNLKNLNINDNIVFTGLINNNLENIVICIDDESTLVKVMSFIKCQDLNDSSIWGEYMDKINNNNYYINNCLFSKDDSYINSNCYKLCSYYYYYDENENKYKCTKELECPLPYDKLIHGKKECVKSCKETKGHKYEFEFGFGKKCLSKCPENFVELEKRPNYCTPECPKETPFLILASLKCVLNCTITQRQNKLCITNYITKKDDNFNIYDLVIEQIRNELKNNFDEIVVDGNKIREKGADITITKTKKKNINDDDINLGECQNRLIQHYNISPNESLYLLRIDVEQIGLQVPSLEYEVYFPLNGTNLVKLNLSICSDIKVDRVVPANISGNIDKYDPNSAYYNDICYIDDSNEETDVSLSDRKQDYADNNLGICERGCDFVSYNYETKKAVCSCGIKTEIPFMDNVKFDKDVLMNSFTDINNIANTKMMKCYNTVFQKKYILKNMGFFIYLCLIVLNSVCLFFFLIKDYKKFIKKIDKIRLCIVNSYKDNNNILNKSRKKRKKKKQNKQIRDDNNNKKQDEIKSSERKLDKNNNIDNIKIKIDKSKTKNSPPKVKKGIQINTVDNKDKKDNINNKIDDNEEKNNKKLFIKKKTKRNNNKSNTFLLYKSKKFRKLRKNKSRFVKVEPTKLNYSEMNSLKFKDALIKDKRTYLEYYISLIILNHLLLFIFYNKDYNSKTIKASILIFNLSAYIAINSLFFSDSTMHKIYSDNGSFNFVYQLPQIIYSTMISAILNGFIKLLGLSEQNVIKMTRMKVLIQNVNKIFNRLYFILRIKFIFFYTVSFSLLLLFWYYVTCFCGIYRNTQTHLLKDSLCSFVTSLVTPFGICLIPGLFRRLALKRKNKILYAFSKILQII